MADPKRLLEDAAAKAMLGAGTDAARRAAHDLISSDEDRAAETAGERGASKRRRAKLVMGGLIGLFLVLGLIGFVLSYWHYFLLAGVLGVAGAYGYYRVRSRRADRRAEETVAEAAGRVRIEASSRPDSGAPEAAARRSAAEAREAREADARALAEARAAEAQAVEDELAALKARIKR